MAVRGVHVRDWEHLSFEKKNCARFYSFLKKVIVNSTVLHTKWRLDRQQRFARIHLQRSSGYATSQNTNGVKKIFSPRKKTFSSAWKGKTFGIIIRKKTQTNSFFLGKPAWRGCQSLAISGLLHRPLHRKLNLEEVTHYQNALEEISGNTEDSFAAQRVSPSKMTPNRQPLEWKMNLNLEGTGTSKMASTSRDLP